MLRKTSKGTTEPIRLSAASSFFAMAIAVFLASDLASVLRRK
ncbi:Uncharacterised protein [Vibrio cholerae]|nr:Uncharacterised protein [Vibrio cholerae]